MLVKTPRQFQLDKAKFPNEPWAQDLVDKLNQFVTEVIVGFQSVPQWTFKEINFVTRDDPADSFPIDIQTEFSPRILVVASVMGSTLWDIEGVSVVWTFLPNGLIRIQNISGLAPRSSNTVRLAYQG